MRNKLVDILVIAASLGLILSTTCQHVHGQPVDLEQLPNNQYQLPDQPLDLTLAWAAQGVLTNYASRSEWWSGSITTVWALDATPFWTNAVTWSKQPVTDNVATPYFTATRSLHVTGGLLSEQTTVYAIVAGGNYRDRFTKLATVEATPEPSARRLVEVLCAVGLLAVFFGGGRR